MKSSPIVFALFLSLSIFATAQNPSPPVPVAKLDGIWARSSEELPDYTKANTARLGPGGLAQLFNKCFALPRPERVQWLAGGYRVKNEEGVVSGSVSGFFQIDPDRVESFADAIVDAWRQRFEGDPDVRISRTKTKRAAEWPEPYLRDPVMFAAGTIHLNCRNPFAAQAEHEYQAYLDPTTGMVWMRSYRGHVVDPAERRKE